LTDLNEYAKKSTTDGDTKIGPPAAFARAGAAIEVWASHWNDDPKPFVWTKTVHDIITEVKRGRAALDRVTESGTHH
jgi:hypothetical protein